MSSAAIVLIMITLCGSLYHVLAGVCGILFYLKRKREILGLNWPKVACLKPLCGYDAETPANLRSFLDQDYPDYEVVFGTAKEEDWAYPVAYSICNEEGRGHCRAVFGEVGQGSNRKVRNLRNIEGHISPAAEVMVLSDSDTRVTRNYLKSIVSPFGSDPTVGAVTAIYRVENSSGLGGAIEDLCIESSFVPGVLFVSTFSRLKYAFGATIAVRRSDFLEAGGFNAVEDYLADDYKIGSIIDRGKKKVVLSPYVVSVISPDQGLKDTFAHLLRWSRTIRGCEPIGYFFSTISYSFLWAILAFKAMGANPLSWIVLGGCCLIRISSAAIVAAAIGSRRGLARAFLAPIGDILSFLLWIGGLVINQVTWRGVKYKVFSDGRMAEVQ
jgi:ceramide glucosyltransferase